MDIFTFFSFGPLHCAAWRARRQQKFFFGINESKFSTVYEYVVRCYGAKPILFFFFVLWYFFVILAYRHFALLWIIDVKTEQLNRARECALCSSSMAAGDMKYANKECQVCRGQLRGMNIPHSRDGHAENNVFFSFHFCLFVLRFSLFSASFIRFVYETNKCVRLAFGWGKRNYTIRNIIFSEHSRWISLYLTLVDHSMTLPQSPNFNTWTLSQIKNLLRLGSAIALFIFFFCTISTQNTVCTLSIKTLSKFWLDFFFVWFC